MEPSSRALIKTVIFSALNTASTSRIKELSPEQKSILSKIILNTDNITTHYQEGKDVNLDQHLLSISQALMKDMEISHLVFPKSDIESLFNPEAAYRERTNLNFKFLLPSEIFKDSFVFVLENLPDNTKNLVNQVLWAHFDLLQNENASRDAFLKAHQALTTHLKKSKLDSEQIKCLEFLLEFTYKEHVNLTPEQVVNKILEEDKNRLAMQKKPDTPMEVLFFIEKSEVEWEKDKQLYLEIENWLRDNKNQLPSWAVSGGLNFSMSRKEMKEAITQKFQALANEGKLIEEDTFNTTHKREDFFPPPERRITDLTRLWGSEFLKSQLPSESTFSTPQNVLIIDKGATDVEVKVYSGGPYLALSTAENGYILAEKIQGSPCAKQCITAEELKKPVYYVDFTENDNILRDSKGIAWIVDTEYKSFAPPELSSGALIVQNYLKKRFKILGQTDYRSEYLSFKIPLSSIKSN